MAPTGQMGREWLPPQRDVTLQVGRGPDQPHPWGGDERGSPQLPEVGTNIDNILKIRDICFPTKVRIVKVIVFPVVMYRCKSWTIKKAEC